MESGSPLLIRATLSHDDNGHRLIARDVASLEDRALSHQTDITITITRPEDLKTWHNSAKSLERGKTNLFFRVVGKKQTLVFGWPYRVKLVRGWGE